MTERYYRSTTSNGVIEVSIREPGGKLPVGEDGREAIQLLTLIIRQIERAIEQDEIATEPQIGANP